MTRAASSFPLFGHGRLAGFLLLYGLFILTGSLYPFSGWMAPEGSPFHFLVAPWPRYITRTDLATNLLSYAPLGYALALACSRPGHRLGGLLWAVLAAALLSFLCEALQQMLPQRIASNLDLLVNTLGALAGALLAIHHQRWRRALLALGRWRRHWFRPGTLANLGLGLLLLGLVAQFVLVPMAGIGWLNLYLHPLDSPQSLTGLNPAWFFALLAELLTLGAFTACLLRPGRYVGGLALLSVVVFFSKLLAATVLLKLSVVGGVFSLETLAAFLLALWLLLLPAVSRHRVQVAAAGMVLLVLLRALLAEDFLPRASVLNIVGLAKHLGAWWPVLGLAWLGITLTRRSSMPIVGSASR
jgi:VanZ family protein